MNQVISKRMVKKQQMQWTPRGAHLLLQTRTKVLNNELEAVFRRWYPQLRITCQTFLDTRHADKDKSNPSGIEDGAELFQAGDPKSVRFINDDQLCRIADDLLRSSVPMADLGIRRSEFR